MNVFSKSWLLAVVALPGVLAAGSAQACFMGLPFSGGSEACPTAAPQTSAPCPTARGDESGCLMSQQDIAQAVGTMGTMAAGGLNLAAGILRTLSDQAGRISLLSQDM